MMIDVKMLKDIAPKSHKSMITEDLADRVNQAVTDPTITEEFKENFVTYIKVLKGGKYSIKDYINAVKFVTYKMLDYPDIDAYIATFPERHKRLRNNGLQKDDMHPYANKFKKSKLVTSIFEQTIIPTHILNAPLYQKALTELSKIMVTSRSDIARVNAATSILQHTKPPETQHLQLDVGVKEDGVVSDLRKAVEDLTEMQMKNLKQGQDLQEVAESKVIDAEYEEE